MINVVNKYKHKPSPNDYYIGRGSPLGNPFTHKPVAETKAIFQCETRQESIDKFKSYIQSKIVDKDLLICKALNEIFLMAKKNDVNLICYCAPQSCHGDILKEIIENKLK